MTKKLNLLLVEDDEVDITAVQQAFKKNNLHKIHQLFIAHNGMEALARLRGQGKKPKLPYYHSLILLNLNLPKMGGIELLRELRSGPDLKATSAIVMTTSD